MVTSNNTDPEGRIIALLRNQEALVLQVAGLQVENTFLKKRIMYAQRALKMMYAQRALKMAVNQEIIKGD